MFGNTPFPTQVVPLSILYSKPAAGPVTLIVAVGAPQVVFVVIEIVGATGVVPATIVTGLLASDTQLLSVVLLAITVYAVADIGVFGNTPFATQVVPLSMLYSSPATGAVTLIVPVVIPQLGAEVIAITGAAGAVAAVTVMPLLGPEIQVLSVVLLAITV